MPIPLAQGFSANDSNAAGAGIHDGVGMRFEGPVSGVKLPRQQQQCPNGTCFTLT
jgi:hypothetical protein